MGADVARASFLASTLAVAVAAGCGGPPVHARAIWIDVREQDGGTRTLHVYDRGELEQLPLLLPEGTPLLRAQLGPDGRGLLIRGTNRDATYVDLEDSRHLPLRLTPPPNQSSDTVAYTSTGDALHWREAETLFVVPLTPGVDLQWSEVGDWLMPLEAPLPGPGWTLSARRAPLLLSSQQAGFGQVVAHRYIDPLSGDADLLELSRAPLQLATPRRIQSCPIAAGDCRSNWALSPDGETATFAPDNLDPNKADCRFMTWRWRDQVDPQCLALPDELDDTPDAVTLLAAIDRDLLVVHDRLRLHVWNTRTDEVESTSIIGLPPFAWREARDGTAIIFISLSGPVVRVGRSGPEILSTTQTTCEPGPGNGGLEVSPDARWAAWGCRPPDDPDQTFQQSAIVRVSAGGLDRFEGIPMVMLSIDDNGDALLYSSETGGGEDAEGVAPELEPLSLWTLSNDDVLRRTDQLEPTPEPILLLQGDQSIFIQSAALD